MNRRAEEIRRQIAHYRLLLAQGIISAHARVYLDKIAELEAELARVEQESEPSKQPGVPV